MAGKYEDLYGPMINDETFDLSLIERMGAKLTLQWLDQHPDQVPGRTITERELERAVDETNNEDMNEYQKAHALLVYLGYTIPERPNAERLAMLVGAFTRMGSYTIDEFGAWLDEHGVKAPGGDDE